MRGGCNPEKEKKHYHRTTKLRIIWCVYFLTGRQRKFLRILFQSILAELLIFKSKSKSCPLLDAIKQGLDVDFIELIQMISLKFCEEQALDG